MKKKYLFALLGIIVFISCKRSYVEKSDPALTKADSLKNLTPLLQKELQIAGDANAGFLLMDKTGKVLYKHYFGNYNDSTYIPIASGAKWLSAAAIMTLVDQHLLNLSDLVTKYYPTSFDALDRRNITVRELLSHTSGFESMQTDNVWLTSNTISLQDAVNGIGQGGYINNVHFPAAAVPYLPNGSQFAYGGTDMQVAGGIAEKLSGKTWDVFFRDNLSSKCNMPNTNYLGYGKTTNYRIAGGAGTRMMEYANFLLMLLNNGKFNGKQVLSAASVAEIEKDETNGLQVSYTPYFGDPLRQNFHYGLGCWIEAFQNGQPSQFGSQGIYGFSPWIDLGRGIIGILFVQASVNAVDNTPSVYAAPYTQIRNRVQQILDY